MLVALEPIHKAMKYDPDYLHTERFFIESVVYDAFNPSMTLLVRFEEVDGISSQKHIFCQPNQIGQLLMGNDENVDRVLTRLVEVLSSDNIGYPEVLDVEALLGHPLTISGWQLELNHPIVENEILGTDEIDFDLFELEQLIPRFS